MHGLPPDFFLRPPQKKFRGGDKKREVLRIYRCRLSVETPREECVNSQIYSLFIVKTLNDKYI